MKKTLTVNLNNTVYHIDSDACELLQQYLNDVETRLSADEKNEVMADIEARISELFSEKLQKGKNVINIADVEEVIGILGKPNQFSEEDNEAEPKTEVPPTSGGPRVKRKFYRDVDNAVLGGVASGLAALLGWDVVLVRILMVLVIFLGYGTLIPIYIVVWLIAPPALTVAQKLEMQGEHVTAERIKSEINNMKSYVESDKFKENASTVGSRFGEFFRILFKVIFGFIGAVMGFVGFVLLGVLLLLLSFMIFEPSMLTGFTPELSMFTPAKLVLMVIALLLIVGIPIFMLIYSAVKIVTGKRGKTNGSFGLVLGIIWFVSIFLFAGLAARTVFTLTKGDMEHLEFYWNDNGEPDVTEARIIEPFTDIEVSGNIEMEIVQDTLNSLVIKTSPAIMSNIKTEVEDGVLKIYTEKFHISRDVKVLLSARQINSIEASGVTRIRTAGRFTTDKLHLDISGASDADLDLQVNQDLKIELSGASHAEIEGVAYNLKSRTTGTSHLDAENLRVKNARVYGSGASQINLNATDSLDVDVSGATSFNNKSKPSFLKQIKTGASEIDIE